MDALNAIKCNLRMLTYDDLKLKKEDQTPDNYVKEMMKIYKSYTTDRVELIKHFARARMGAFEAEHVKNAKPVGSYSPVKGYKSSDI